METTDNKVTASEQLDYTDQSDTLYQQMAGVVSLFAAIREFSKDANYHKQDIAGLSQIGETLSDSIRGNINQLTIQLSKAAKGEQ